MKSFYYDCITSASVSSTGLFQHQTPSSVEAFVAQPNFQSKLFVNESMKILSFSFVKCPMENVDVFRKIGLKTFFIFSHFFI